jgi:hypothetical protein
MKLIKISISKWKEQFYPNKAVNKTALDFYKFLKTKNIILDFYHGTSDIAYEIMLKEGWMVSPKLKGREKEESRYNIHNEVKSGLDKLFFTTSIGYASNYAERDAKGWNSNNERAIENKKLHSIDLEREAKPKIIKLRVPLYELDEIKGNIFGTFIYNESDYDKSFKEIINSSENNEEKLAKILEEIKKSEKSRNEFTVKGGLPIQRKEGFSYITESDETDYSKAREEAIIYISFGYVDYFKKLDDFFNNLFSQEIDQLKKEAYPKARENAVQYLSDGYLDDFRALAELFDNYFSQDEEIYMKAKEQAIGYLYNGHFYKFITLDNIFNNRLSQDEEIYLKAREKAIKYLSNENINDFEQLDGIFNNRLSKEPEIHQLLNKNKKANTWYRLIKQ